MHVFFLITILGVSFAKVSELQSLSTSNVIPSGELTYPTLGKGKSSSKVPYEGIC